MNPVVGAHEMTHLDYIWKTTNPNMIDRLQVPAPKMQFYAFYCQSHFDIFQLRLSFSLFFVQLLSAAILDGQAADKWL